MSTTLMRRCLPLATAALLATTSAIAAAAQDGLARPSVLDSIAGAAVAQNRSVGAVVAVVKGNDTLLMKAYGKADIEWDVPLTTDAMFEIGSVTKQFTAAAILQLKDAGKLSLDDDVAKWLPYVGESGRGVTLRRLLSHTAGIHNFTEENEFELNYFAPRLPRDSAQRFIKLGPSRFAVGDAQAYSNSGFWLLGLVVERASGMRLEEYFAKRIFEPLGMTRSMYCNTLQNVTRRAHGYGMQGPGVVRRAPSIDYTWVFAPGAICSTAGDLVRWLQALHGGRVMSAESYAEMTTPATLNDGTPIRYGFGIKAFENHRGTRYVGHGGTAPGFRSDAAWYPDAQMAVVVLMNTSPSNIVPQGVSMALANEVIPWKHREMRFYTDDPSPFVGRYRLEKGGNAPPGVVLEIIATPRGLAISAGGGQPEPLPWVGGLTFFVNEGTTITFRRANGNSGPVTEMRRDDAGNHAILRKQ